MLLISNHEVNNHGPLLCARGCAKHITSIISFTSANSSKKWIQLLRSFYRQGKHGSQPPGDLPRVTELIQAPEVISLFTLEPELSFLGQKIYLCFFLLYCFSAVVQFSSVAQLCPTLCDSMDCSMPGLPVHHQLPEFTQTHVH